MTPIMTLKDFLLFFGRLIWYGARTAAVLGALDQQERKEHKE